jgi:VIT1/CCC1 family predicted Fe2+/Mn2+ transporter
MADTQTTAAHLEAARRRGRHLLAAEDDFGLSLELLQASSAARDAAIVILILWMTLLSSGQAEHNAILLPAAIALALYTGVAGALAVRAQLRHWAAELRREQDEIRHQPQQERDEVRALYEAKGFTGPVLDEIVDTLCADDERLLRVMLEEELGIFLEHSHHPVVIGALTGLGALLGGLSVALSTIGPAWLTPTVVALLLLLIALLRAGGLRRTAVESFARWCIAAGTTGGLAYFVGQLVRA